MHQGCGGRARAASHRLGRNESHTGCEFAIRLSNLAQVSEMAEPGEKRPLGFDALVGSEEEEEGGGYTVKFSSTERESPEAAQEEINLIEQGEHSDRDAAEKVSQRALIVDSLSCYERPAPC